MKKRYVKSGFIILSMSISLSSWAANPCMPIGMDCMKLGYYKGGEKVGKGLIKDCIIPVTEGTKTIPNPTYSAADVTACSAAIAEKEKSSMNQ